MILCCLNLNAQTIITDRPDQTESSSTIQQGSVQIESGVLISQNSTNYDFYSTNERNIYFPSTLFRIGLTEKIEFRLFNQYQQMCTQTNSFNGFNNLELGLKLQLLQKENGFTELAFLSHIVLPTAPSTFSESSSNYTGIVNKLCVSHSLNEKIGLGYNLGYNYFSSGLGDFTYSIVFGFELNEKINTYIEPYGAIPDFDDPESNINMGITYLIKDNLQLDYSYGLGLNHSFNFMSIGCSININ